MAGHLLRPWFAPHSLIFSGPGHRGPELEASRVLFQKMPTRGRYCNYSLPGVLFTECPQDGTSISTRGRYCQDCLQGLLSGST